MNTTMPGYPHTSKDARDYGYGALVGMRAEIKALRRELDVTYARARTELKVNAELIQAARDLLATLQMHEPRAHRLYGVQSRLAQLIPWSSSAVGVVAPRVESER